MVLDEETDEYKPRYGYKSVDNDGVDDQFIEHKGALSINLQILSLYPRRGQLSTSHVVVRLAKMTNRPPSLCDKEGLGGLSFDLEKGRLI
jgi:hypothetical protein